MGCVQILFFWAREVDRRVFFFPCHLSFSERKRRQKRSEQKKTNLYLEQLRRPGAEAVGLSQVEGPEIRVERLVDLGILVKIKAGSGRKMVSVGVREGEEQHRGIFQRERERDAKKKDEDEKRERK